MSFQLGNIGLSKATKLTKFVYELHIDVVADSLFKNNTTITDIEILDADSILSNTFQGCNSLTNLVLPGIATYSNLIFSSSLSTKPLNLTNIKICEGTTKVNTVFLYLPALSSIEFPSTLTKFTNSILKGCTKITKLNVLGLTLDTQAFGGLTNLKLLAYTLRTTTPSDIGLTSTTGASDIANVTLLTVLVDGDQLLKKIFCNPSLENLVFSNNGEHITALEDAMFMNLSKIDKINLNNSTLTCIPTSAFYNTQAEICVNTDNILKIESNAFYGNTNLNFNTFSNLTSIEYIGTPLTLTDYPNKLKHIGENGLKNLTLTTNSTINLTVDEFDIGKSVFELCNMKSLNVNCNLAELPEKVCYNCTFLDDLQLNSSVTTIGKLAFGNCLALTEVDLDYVTTIKESAFANSGLTDVSFNSIVRIETNAFNNTKLVDIIIPTIFVTDLTSFGTTIFNNCSNVKTLNIDATSKELNESWGSRCGKNLEITNPLDYDHIAEVFTAIKNLFGITSSNFAIYLTDVTLTKDGKGNEYKCLKYNLDNSTLTAIDIAETDYAAFKSSPQLPSYTEKIGNNAIENITDLTKIVLDENLTSIGNSACKNNYFTEIDLCNVIEIGTNTFQYSHQLTEITIPFSTTTIGEYAFANIATLTSFTIIPSSKTTTLPSNVLYENTNIATLSIYQNITTLSENSLNGLSENLKVYFDTRYQSDALELLGNNIPKAANKTRFYCLDNNYRYPMLIVNSNTIKTINNKAFEVNQNLELEHVYDDLLSYGTLTESMFTNIVKIKAGAFNGITRSTLVVLPISLTAECEEGLFTGFDSLVEVRLNTNYVKETHGSLLELWDCKLAKIVFNNGTLYWDGTNSIFISDSEIFDYNFVDLDKQIIGTFNDRIPANSISSTVPGDYKIIGSNAFEHTVNLTSLTATSIRLIKDEGFSKNQSLKSIILSTTLTSIGSNAFKNTMLSSLTIPGSITAIEGYGLNTAFDLKELTFGNGVKLINDNAFEDNTANISSLNFPTTLTSIGKYAFAEIELEFPRLENVNFNTVTELLTISDCAFYNSILTLADNKLVFSNNLLSIGSFAFAYSDEAYTHRLSALNTATDEIVTSFRLKFIGDGAFLRNRFKKITLNNGLLWIGDYAFAYPKYKYSIAFPSTIEHIGRNAFLGSIVLNPDKVSANIIKINKHVSEFPTMFGTEQPDELCSTENTAGFSDHICLSSTRDDYYKASVYIYNNRMNYVPVPLSIDMLKKSVFSCDNNVTTAFIPALMTAIGIAAFKDCSNMTMLSVNAEKLRISSSAFENCSKMERIGNDVDDFELTSVEEREFYNNLKLENIKLLSTCEYIRDLAFYNCKELVKLQDVVESYDILNCLLTSIGNSAFMDCSKLTEFRIYPSLSNIGEEPFKNCSSMNFVRIYMNDFDFLSLYNTLRSTACTLEETISNLFISIRSDYKCEIQFNNSTYMNNGKVKIDTAYIKTYVEDSTKPLLSSISVFMYYKAIDDNKTYLNLSSIERVDPFVFNNATMLETINFLDAEDGTPLQYIGDYAFNHCENILAIRQNTLSCKTIGQYSFAACKKLAEMTIYLECLDTIGQGVFYDTLLLKLTFVSQYDTLEESITKIKEKIHYEEETCLNPLELPEYCKIYVIASNGDIGKYDYMFRDLNHCSIDTNRNQLVFVDKTRRSVCPLLVVQKQTSTSLPALLKNNFHVNIVGRWK